MPDVIDTTGRDAPAPTPMPDDDGGWDDVPAAARPQPDQQTPAAVELARRNEQVSAVAEAVLAMPGVAGRDEFLSLAMQARMLSLSGAAPEAVRGNPYVAFHVAMVGRDLGLSPSAALELIDVIPGKKGPQLSLSPQLMNAQVHRVYGGEIVPADSTVSSCTAVAVGPGGRDRRCRIRWPEHVDDCTCDILGSVTFTWDDARMAELVGPNCQPGAHVKDQTRSSNGRSWKVCGCNQGYVTYPKRMMWQRACGFAADDYFPGAGLGLYTPEALGAVVDEEGRAIDPGTIELPEGYQPAAVGAGAAPAADDPADAAELTAFQVRLLALPPEQQDQYKTLKHENERLQGTPVYQFGRRQLRLARNIVGGLESNARRDGVDLDAAQDAVRQQLAEAITSALSGPTGASDPVTKPETAAAAPVEEGEPAADTAPEAPQDGPAAVTHHDDTPAAATAPQAPASGADASDAMAEATEAIRAMSNAEVRAELVALQLPTDGGPKAHRARLLNYEVQRYLAATTPPADTQEGAQ